MAILSQEEVDKIKEAMAGNGENAAAFTYMSQRVAGAIEDLIETCEKQGGIIKKLQQALKAMSAKHKNEIGQMRAELKKRGNEYLIV